MSEWPEFDWAHDPDNDPEETFSENIDKEVAGLAYRLLDSLSQDVTALEGDVHGWTVADEEAVNLTWETDWLARLVVPPKTVPDEARTDFVELMVSFRTALPFTEAERNWLLDGNRNPDRVPHYEVGAEGSASWRELASQSEDEVMSAGIRRVIHGRDLLYRWWSWRREAGEYAVQGSLDQARSALERVIGLLAPELGLPETYVALRGKEGNPPASNSHTSQPSPRQTNDNI